MPSAISWKEKDVKLEDEIVAVENRIRAAKSELHYLREKLADEVGWPRIAKGVGYASGELHLVVGVYYHRLVVRRIRDDGSLGMQTSGSAITGYIHDGTNTEPSYLTKKETRIKAARHHNRKWAKRFLT